MKKTKTITKQIKRGADTSTIKSKKYGKAIVSLVMGVVSIVLLGFFPYYVTVLCSIGAGAIGIVTGVEAKKENEPISRSGRALAIAGIICSVAGIACHILGMLMVFFIIIEFEPFLKLLPYEEGHFRFLGIDW